MLPSLSDVRDRRVRPRDPSDVDATASSDGASARAHRRDAIGLLVLVSVLSLGAGSQLVPLDVRPQRGSAFGLPIDPTMLWLATLAILAVLAARTLRLGSRCRRLEHAQRHDQHAARHDVLTGAANRRWFEQRLDTLLEDPSPAHALLMIDLDRFKPVNDLYGHAAGDALLREITTGLDRIVGSAGLVARLGGDEFAILLENTTPPAAERQAMAVLEFVRGYRLTWDGQRISVGASIGLVAVDCTGTDRSDWLAAADAALYAAKEAGRGAVFVTEFAAAERNAAEPLGTGVQRRLDAGLPEPVASARSHEPEDGRRQVLHGWALWCRPLPSHGHHVRQGSRRRRDLAHWIAVEPATVGDTVAPGLTSRELLETAARQADGGADLARWTLAMTLDAASRHPPMVLGRIGFVLPVPARAIVAVPTLGEEMLRMNALSLRPLRHLSIVLHDIAPVQTMPAVAAFRERMTASDVRVGFEIRSATLDVLAPLRHVSYDELHLARELSCGLRPNSAAAATIEALRAVSACRDLRLIASGVESADTAKQLGALGVDRLGGPGIAPSRPLDAILDRLRAADRPGSRGRAT